MTPLCSVLIPTRKRFDKLLKTIHSVYEASDREDLLARFEVIVRFHETDTEALDRAREINELATYFFGEDLNGYHSLGPFCHEMIQLARGKWVWHLNDDMVVEADRDHKWNTELLKVPSFNLLVQPQWHQLNTSHYGNDGTGPAPFHERKVLGEVLLEPDCGSAVDATIYRELVEKRKYGVWFLKGITVKHEWGGIESHVT